MLKACSMRMSARLALLQHDSTGKAMLFECAAPRANAPLSTGSQSSRNQLVSAADTTADVVATGLNLSNTLLASAISQKQARFISDCGQYMQTCVRPARDVFTRISEMVSSIVVVPLIPSDQQPLGALYYTLTTPCEFANIQDTLLGFVGGITPMLHNKLAGRAQVLAAMVAKVSLGFSVPRLPSSTTTLIACLLKLTRSLPIPKPRPTLKTYRPQTPTAGEPQEPDAARDPRHDVPRADRGDGAPLHLQRRLL